jgi:hypothetical protein
MTFYHVIRPSRLVVLDDAGAAINGERDLNYGSPEENFGRIAGLLNAYMAGRPEGEIKPHEVAIFNILLKIGRLQNSPDHRDSWVDIAGYAACGYEVA